jgi:hypothetical protein
MRPSGRGSDSQLGLLLRRLCEVGDIPEDQRAKIMGENMIDAETLDAFVTAVYKVHPRGQGLTPVLLRERHGASRTPYRARRLSRAPGVSSTDARRLRREPIIP